MWKNFSLWKPSSDYLFLHCENRHKYVIDMMRKYGGVLYLNDYNLICYDLADYDLIDYDLSGYDLVAYDLTNEASGVRLFGAQKHQERLAGVDIRETSKEVDVAELGNQEKGLNIAISLDGLKGNMCMWRRNKKWLFSMKKNRVVAAPTLILANYSFKFINVVPNWRNKTDGVVFAWDWSPKELMPWRKVPHDEVLTELRSIPFEEGGDDTCMDRDKSRFDHNGPWVVFDNLFFNYLALMSYTTMIYLINFSTCQWIQAICKVIWCLHLGLEYNRLQWLNECALGVINQIHMRCMLMHGCMVYGFMATWKMDNLNSKDDDLVLSTWQGDIAASDMARFECMATCIDDVAGVG